MPTFGKYEINKSLDDFKNTEFYKKWMELLNNEKLFAILENTNTKLIFYCDTIDISKSLISLFSFGIVNVNYKM